jgi:hypothetical protein
LICDKPIDRVSPQDELIRMMEKGRNRPAEGLSTGSFFTDVFGSFQPAKAEVKSVPEEIVEIYNATNPKIGQSGQYLEPFVHHEGRKLITRRG